MPENLASEIRADRTACARCGDPIERGRDPAYVVEIRCVADPHGPVFHPDDLTSDPTRAIQQLLRQLQSYAPAQLRNELHARRLHMLCPHCYQAWLSNPFSS